MTTFETVIFLVVLILGSTYLKLWFDDRADKRRDNNDTS